MDDICDVYSYLEMRMLRYTGHLMRRQDEHPTLTSMAMGGQLDMEAFPYRGTLSASAPGPQQWGPRLGRILQELLPPKPRVRGPSGNDFHGAEAYMQAQDEFKAASLQEKAAYEVWFKRVGKNKYAMFDEVARERGTWDDLCVEPQVRAFARRGLCKPCKKYYTDSKGPSGPRKATPCETTITGRQKGGINYGRKMFQIDKMCIYKLERGQNHSIGVVLLRFGAYLERGGFAQQKPLRHLSEALTLRAR